MSTEAESNDDICGLCGEPGADKIPHPIHWPGETLPSTELVHASCEQEECGRAHRELWGKDNGKSVASFLRAI